MIAEKICKPQGKTIGFKSCLKLTPVSTRKFGLCPSCFPTWLFSDNDLAKLECDKFLKSNATNFKKKVKKADNETRQSLKTLSQYEADAKKSFQKWVRLRDADLNCISCNTATSDLWDGGHYFKAELFSGLIFDQRNVNKQCRYCNRFLGGNEIQYRLGLVERYGPDFVTDLESESNGLRNIKYTKIELIEIKRLYDARLKELK